MTAMEQKGRAAIGRFVLSTKEHLVLLRAVGRDAHARDALLPRGRPPEATSDEISERLEGVEVSDEELAMAEQLVEGLARPFEPEAYPNETRAALLEFLQAKAEGEEIAEPEEAPEPAPVIDLMAALKASLAAAGGGEAPAAAGDGRKKDEQLDLEQSRLRGVEGGGEGDGAAKKPARKRSSAKKTAAKAKSKDEAPAKKTAASRRKAS